MSSPQRTETRTIPLPPLSSLVKQIPDIEGVDLTLPTQEYARQGDQAASEGNAVESQRWLWAGLRVAYARDERELIERFIQKLNYWEQVQGRVQRQVELLVALIDIMENRGHEDEVSEHLQMLAQVRMLQGYPELAQLSLDRANSNWRWKNNWGAVANSHSFMGKAYLSAGNFPAALAELLTAKRLRETQPVWNPDYRSSKEPLAPASSLDDLANFFFAIGLTERAIAYKREAIRVRTPHPGQEPHILALLLSIADIYFFTGDLDRSLSAAREAETYQGGRLRGADAHIGRIWLARGKGADAEKSFREELQRLQGDDPRDVQSLKMELAKALSIQGKHGEALRLSEEVLAFLERMHGVQPLIEMQVEASPIALRAKETQKAKALLTHARRLIAPEFPIIWRIQTLQKIGAGFSLLGDGLAAEEAYRAAVTLYESLLPMMLDPNQAALFAIAWAGELYHALAQTSTPEEALLWLERGRGQVLAQQIARGRLDLSRLLSPTDAKQLQRIRKERVEAGAQHRAALVSDDATPDSRIRAKQRLETVDSRYTDLQAELTARYPNYRSVEAPRPPTKKHLEALAARNPDTLFVEWLVGEGSTFCCTLTAREGVKVSRLPVGKVALDKQVAAWRAAILSGSIKDRQHEPQLARELGQLLLPALPRGIKRLVLVPDGPLQTLPFAALCLADGRRLVERCTLSQAFSLGALLWEKEARPSSPSPRRHAYCIASASAPASQANTPIRGIPGIAYGPLRYADKEAAQIAQLLGAPPPLLGKMATERAIRSAMQRATIIHLVAHGVVLPDNSLYSWLLLSGSGSQDEDGRLEAREIAEMRLSAELAVLSACDTALADNSGIQGFAWAFRAAGCPAIAATLWKIDDAATATLMETFYRGLQQGRPKDEALCLAQRSLLQGRVSTWAGWVLFGATSPLTVLRSLPA